MRTLIEIFDSCQTENVIAALRFLPEKIVFVGNDNLLTESRKRDVESFFEERSMRFELEFKKVSRNDYERTTEVLNAVIDENEDCCIDITGGTDLLLAASGAVSALRGVPMIRFNVRTGRFMPLSGDCSLPDEETAVLKIDELIALNGGAVIEDESGGLKWSLTKDFRSDIETMWELCRKNCGLWNRQINVFGNFDTYGHMDESLNVRASLEHINGIGQDTVLNKRIMNGLTKAGLIKDLREEGGILYMTYKNGQVHRCLTKAGNILELYVYMLLTETAEKSPGFYDDIDIGVCVDWDGELHGSGATAYDTRNEVDIIVMRDAVPIFISCKNGEVRKEALYELDTVADHFGGQYVKKVLLTTYISGSEDARRYVLQRARDMRIDIIEGIDKLDKKELMRTLKARIK